MKIDYLLPSYSGKIFHSASFGKCGREGRDVVSVSVCQSVGHMLAALSVGRWKSVVLTIPFWFLITIFYYSRKVKENTPLQTLHKHVL